MDSAFYTNPYPFYAQLRRGGAIHFSEAFGEAGAWLIPRYDGVARVFNESAFSAVRSHKFFDHLSSDARAKVNRFERIFKQWVVFLDPPTHTFWRRTMMTGFSPKRVLQMRAAIEATVDGLIDRMAEKGKIDFIGDFTHVLPVYVVSALMGIDIEDRERFVSWSDDIAAFFGNPGASHESAEKAQTAVVAIHDGFEAIIRDRLDHPRDDAVSLMIQSIRSSGASTEEQQQALFETLPSQCSALLFAGHETTSSTLGNGVYALLNHPDQLDLLVRNPGLAEKCAREIVRFDTAGQFSTRIVKERCEFLGRTLEPEQMVIGLVGSANRDEEKFQEPDRFKIERTDAASPLTFGNGPHYCLGSHLGTLEITIAVEQLFARFRRFELLSASVEWMTNFNFRSIKALPMSLA